MRRRRLPTFLFAALLLPGWGTVRADIQAPPARGRGRANEPAVSARVRPANATDASVQVPLGGSAEITLHARGQLGKNVGFLLRDPPVHGTVSEPRPTGRDTAVVTYTHRAGDGATADLFTYAVQAPGTAVSAMATVEVRVTDEPPRIAVVENPGLDFGAVLPGAEARRELMLENRGGGVAVGTLAPPDPWGVEGAASYRLARAERQAFTLVFRPGVARTFDGRVILGRADDQSAQLTGVGLRADGSLPPSVSAPGFEENPGVSAPPPGSRAVASVKPSVPTSGNLPPPVPPPSPSSVDGVGPDHREASSQPPSVPFAPLETSSPPVDGEAPVKNLALQARGAHTLTVSWPVPKPLPASYRVELRRFWIDGGQQLQSRWDTYPGVAIRPGTDNTVQATVRALPAGINQTLRVVAVDNRGALSPPSAPLQAATLPARPWGEFVTPVRALWVGFGVCLFLLFRQRRTGQSGW